VREAAKTAAEKLGTSLADARQNLRADFSNSRAP